MSVQRVAEAFWPSVQDPEIADVLFGHARHIQRNEQGTGPTDTVAAKHYKGGVVHAAAVAGSTNVDPAILRKFAKDGRVAVRQNLLENPATPRDTLVELTVWKFERNDGDIVACAERLTLAELLDVFGRFAAQHGESRLAMLDLAAWGLVPSLGAEPAMAIPLAKAGPIPFVVVIAKSAYAGNIPGVSLGDVLDARPEAAERSLQIILAECNTLTRELATRWRAWRDHPETRVYRHFGFNSTPFRHVEQGAADILVGGDVAQLHAAVLNGASSGLLAETFPGRPAEELRHVVEVLDRRALCQKAETALVDRIIELAGGRLGKFPLPDLISGLRHRLDDDKLVALLRVGGVGTLHWWLNNTSCVNGPRPGILTMLARRPRWQAANLEADVDLRSESIVTTLTWSAHDHPWIAGEVVAIHDAYVGSHLGDRHVAKLVYPLLEKAFAGPEKRAAWETFVTLAGDWSDTFTGILDAVHGLLGITPETSADPTGDTPLAGTTEQLTLL